ncbi:hypothetical protein Tco_0808132 [Tanacetum coccineum]
MSCSNHHPNFSRKPRMSVRQVWKRKTSTQKPSSSFQSESPPLPPQTHHQSISPPSYNPLRDEMINSLHNISTILDTYNNPSNAYTQAPPSPPPQKIYPPSHDLVSSDLILSSSSHLSSLSSAREEHLYSSRNKVLISDLSSLLLSSKPPLFPSNLSRMKEEEDYKSESSMNSKFRVGLVDAVVPYLIQFAAEISVGTLLIRDVATTCVGSTRGATQGRPRYKETPDRAPTFSIQNQRYDDPEKAKTRNRFPLSVLMEVNAQNYQNTCNNDKNLSEIKLEHEKEDELIVMVVKVVHELDCMMVVKEIEDGFLEELEVRLFGKKVMICSGFLTLPYLSYRHSWFSREVFEQDIGGESEDDREKKLVMVSEEAWMS